MFDELVTARASYAYPAVGLVAVERLRAPSTWEDDLVERRFADTLALDDYHRKLLHSEDDADIVTGVFSVVYWRWTRSGPHEVGRDRQGGKGRRVGGGPRNDGLS